jgi:hypothetical protein
LSLIGPFSSAFLSQPCISPPFPSFVTSALKMETICVSETLTSTYKPTRRRNPKRQHKYNRFKGSLSLSLVVWLFGVNVTWKLHVTYVYFKIHLYGVKFMLHIGSYYKNKKLQWWTLL